MLLFRRVELFGDFPNKPVNRTGLHKCAHSELDSELKFDGREYP